jgi:hypothetical protein
VVREVVVHRDATDRSAKFEPPLDAAKGRQRTQADAAARMAGSRNAKAFIVWRAKTAQLALRRLIVPSTAMVQSGPVSPPPRAKALHFQHRGPAPVEIFVAAVHDQPRRGTFVSSGETA